MFCFCFSSTENPPLGMLTEARLNLDTRSGKSKEIQLKVWKKWNKGKRKICHRSFTLDKSAGLERKTTEGLKTAKNILFFWTSIHFVTRIVDWLRRLWVWCVCRFYQLWPHHNSIVQISQNKIRDIFHQQNQIVQIFSQSKTKLKLFCSKTQIEVLAYQHFIGSSDLWASQIVSGGFQK